MLLLISTRYFVTTYFCRVITFNSLAERDWCRMRVQLIWVVGKVVMSNCRAKSSHGPMTRFGTGASPRSVHAASAGPWPRRPLPQGCYTLALHPVRLVGGLHSTPPRPPRLVQPQLAPRLVQPQLAPRLVQQKLAPRLVQQKLASVGSTTNNVDQATF